MARKAYYGCCPGTGVIIIQRGVYDVYDAVDGNISDFYSIFSPIFTLGFYLKKGNDDDMATTVRVAAETEISKTEVVTKTSLSLLISEKYFQLQKHQDIIASSAGNSQLREVVYVSIRLDV